ncbi:hypothetical protein ACWEQL_35605 [Kitasatospora sp. NPDC004240]
MASRGSLLPVSVLVAAAVLGLAACGPEESGGPATGAAPTAAASVTGTASPGATAGGTAKPSGSAKPAGTAKPGASGGAEGEPEGFCSAAPLPAGQKWVYPVKGTTATTLVYKDTKEACGVNDVNFEPVGEDRTAPFAPTAKGHLNSVMAKPKDVDVADLVKHINECLADRTSTKGSYPCSAGDYKVAIDASGKVVEMTERAHS